MGVEVSAIDMCDRVDLGILGWIQFLDRKRRVATGSKASYAFPSQGFLAVKLGVTRETICRHVRWLRLQGILSVTHRRKVQGHFRSCLYTILQYRHWGWAKVREALRSSSNRVTKASHIVPPKRETLINLPPPDEQDRVRQSLRDLWSSLEAKRR